jgi:hypothetical protein
MKRITAFLLIAALALALTACAEAPESNNLNCDEPHYEEPPRFDEQFAEKLKTAAENDLFVIMIYLHCEDSLREIHRIVLEEHGMDSEYYLGVEFHSDEGADPETGECTRTLIAKCGTLIKQDEYGAFHDVYFALIKSSLITTYTEFTEQHIAPEYLMYEFAWNRNFLVVEATRADIEKFLAMDIVSRITEIGYCYVGHVRVASNQTEHKPFENWNHGYSEGLSATGFALGPEHVLGLAKGFSEHNTQGQILPHVIYADDFELTVPGSLVRHGVFIFDYNRQGSFILHKNEYTVETIQPEYDWSIPYDKFTFTKITDGDIDTLDKLYSALSEAESGEYILSLYIWWHGEDSGSSYDYHFKIIID